MKPPRISYRLRKAIRRHRTMVVAVSSIVLALTVGLILSMRSEKRAIANAKIARDSLAKVLRLSDVKRISELLADADALWPAVPGEGRGHGSMDRASDQPQGPSGHRSRGDSLATLREKALPYDDAARTWDREHHSRAAELAWLLDSRRRTQDEIATPASPEDSERLRELTLALPKIEDEISAVEREVQGAGQQTWAFADAETQWQHDVLAELVQKVEGLGDKEKGLIADVNRSTPVRHDRPAADRRRRESALESGDRVDPRESPVSRPRARAPTRADPHRA